MYGLFGLVLLGIVPLVSQKFAYLAPTQKPPQKEEHTEFDITAKEFEIIDVQK